MAVKTSGSRPANPARTSWSWATAAGDAPSTCRRPRIDDGFPPARDQAAREAMVIGEGAGSRRRASSRHSACCCGRRAACVVRVHEQMREASAAGVAQARGAAVAQLARNEELIRSRCAAAHHLAGGGLFANGAARHTEMLRHSPRLVRR